VKISQSQTGNLYKVYLNIKYKIMESHSIQSDIIFLIYEIVQLQKKMDTKIIQNERRQRLMDKNNKLIANMRNEIIEKKTMLDNLQIELSKVDFNQNTHSIHTQTKW